VGKPFIWYQKNLDLVRHHYGKEPLERTHERIVKQVREDAQTEGRQATMPPSVRGVIFAAHRIGLINEAERDRACKEHKNK